ncbi:lipase [Porphyromonas gulae]|uniref:SGNH/GDSL hydrolase family protein n=2 Tax=Porphyromonas gulae TaxID=111105 RepID=UPI000377744F|nr:SGNH/GDSL hydrolase family protein [Porphyromonas gulae]KGN67254.1 lipase [Porphyromonas gulae]KGN79911.1 lipase [Porphyromonas gulae]
MEGQRNQMARFWLLLVVTAILLAALFYLPEQIGSWQLKPVDLLSDVRRVKPDSTAVLIAPKHTPPSENNTDNKTKSDKRRSAIYSQLLEQNTVTDSTFIPIEDYSSSRTALKRFYTSITERSTLGRPIRIAVLGDSFIEGDIFTDALRAALQKRFGGNGVGWMPITSEVAGFRGSIRHEFRQWDDHSLLRSKKGHYPFTGHFYRPKQGAWVRYAMPLGQPNFGHAILYYKSTDEASVRIETSDTTLTVILPPTETVGQYTLSSDPQRSIKCSVLSGGQDFVSFGVALEDAQGISVDNMSIRGNSGTLLKSINPEVSREFASLRNYDLIILQYGLNVASNKQKDYSNYAKQMGGVIEILRSVCPEADILLMSVSDRAQRTANGIRTMSGVIALHSAQQALAQQYGVAFWSTLRAMHSLGGISRMADKGWAARDYTHLAHRGGRELAKKMIEAFDFEKKYYDAIRE